MTDEEFAIWAQKRREKRIRKRTEKAKYTKLLHKQCLYAFKPIVQYTKQGEVVNIFKDVWDAEHKLNINVNYIIRVVTYRQHSTSGYVFRFQDKIEDKRCADMEFERVRRMRNT